MMDLKATEEQLRKRAKEEALLKRFHNGIDQTSLGDSIMVPCSFLDINHLV